MDNAEMKMIQGMFESLMTEVQGVKSEVQGIKSEMQEVKQRVGNIELTLENVTNKNISILHDGYQQTYEKVSVLEKDVQDIKDNTEILKALTEYHK